MSRLNNQNTLILLLIRPPQHAPEPILAEAISLSADQCQTAGSITLMQPLRRQP
jgi:hypothetical protein